MTRISCDDAQALMRQALGDGDRGAGPSLDTHVAECPACAEAWEAQQSVRALLASREPELLPAGFAARLDAAIDDLEPWWARIDWRWWTLRVAPVATVLLLLVGGATLRSSSATSSSSTTSSSVSTALWDGSSTVSSDSLLLAVLSGSPDDTVSRYEGSAR
jgi:anti-sigma factor RsiW